MKPTFTSLMTHYPSSERREVLYKQIGWDDVVNNPAFQDTCAIRMSIALLGAGVRLTSSTMTIHAGPLKGKRIETGQGRLSHDLKRMWGKPEVCTSEQAAKDGIGSRRGVVSFFRLRHFGIPTNGGHIDLVYPAGIAFRDVHAVAISIRPRSGSGRSTNEARPAGTMTARPSTT